MVMLKIAKSTREECSVSVIKKRVDVLEGFIYGCHGNETVERSCGPCS